MKASEFKKILKEAVREVVREELAPVKKAIIEGLNKRPSPVLHENNRGEKIVFAGTNGPVPFKRPVAPQRSTNPIMSILEETKASMTADDYNTIIKGESSMASGFDPAALAAEMGYTSGLEEFTQGGPQVVNSVQDMISSAKPAYQIMEPEQVGEIKNVPDFSKFMSVLKSKGKL